MFIIFVLAPRFAELKYSEINWAAVFIYTCILYTLYRVYKGIRFAYKWMMHQPGVATLRPYNGVPANFRHLEEQQDSDNDGIEDASNEPNLFDR